MRRSLLLAGGLVLAAVLAACGGGGGGGTSGGGFTPGGGSGPTPCPPGYTGTAPNCTGVPIQGLPASGITFSGLGASAAATVTATQPIAGTITEADTCATIAPVTSSTPSPTQTTAGLTISITPHAPGTCAVNLTGALGVTASIPISVALSDVQPNITWGTSVGPVDGYGSGKLNNFLVAPTNGAVMYVAGGVGASDPVSTSAGIYKSTNGGASWSPANNGLTDTTVNALWMDPSNSQVLVAATEYAGIFRTNDGANTWVQVSAQTPIYNIVSANGTLYAPGANGVYTSGDDGVTWTNKYAIPNQAESVAVAGSTVYIGDVTGNLYVSTSGGAPVLSYTFPSTGLNPDVRELAVDAAVPTTAYAEVDGYSNAIYSSNLYVTTDGGAVWTSIPIPSNARGAQALAMSAVTPHQVYVLGTQCLTATAVGATLNSCGYYGDGRNILPDPSLPVSDIPVGAAGSEPLLATGDQGAYIGAANACCATSVTVGLSANIVRSLVVAGSSIATTMQDFAPEFTSDGGQSWAFATTDSQENGFLYQNPKNPSYCYLFDQIIHVSTDGCHTFDDTDHGYGGVSGGTTIMAFDPSTPLKAYLATATGVYVTTNGVTFAPTGWAIQSPVNVAVDPVNAQHIFVSSTTGGGFGTVYYTTDGGTTWNASTGILPHSASYGDDAPVIAVSPTHDYIVFAATGTEIFRSVDGGKTFASLETFAPDAVLVKAAQRRVAQLRAANGDDDIDTRTGKVKAAFSAQSQTFAASVAGVNVGETLAFADNTPAGAVAPLAYTLPTRSLLVSTDYGAHWHDISSNSISRWFSQVAFQNGTMYVATMGNGVLVSTSALHGAAAARAQRFSLTLARHSH